MTSDKKPLWDIPTRVCHWLFVIVIGFSWWSVEYDHLEWHTWSGYTLLVLIIFRIVWGIIGSHTAQFHHFLSSPRAFFSYSRTLFKKDSKPSVGHNPMGAWSVVLLLLLMLAQVLLGLFSEDVDGLASGPLSFWVSYDTGRWAAETHEDLFDYLLAFIALHVGVIFFYLIYKKDNLILPMITGKKDKVDTQSLRFSPTWLALIILAMSSAFVWWLVT